MNFSSPARKFFFPAVSWLVLAGWIAGLGAFPARAENTNAADLAWAALKHDSENPPEPLKQLPDRMFTSQEIQAYYTKVANRGGEVADEARQFYTQYPEHPQAAEARNLYFNLLLASVALSSTNKIAELEAVTAERLKDPQLDDNARFQLSLQLLHSAVSGRQYISDAAMRAELERRARQLIKDYPARPDGCNFLLNLARKAAPEKSAALAREILLSSSDPKTTTECEGLINRAAALDKPLTLKLPLPGGTNLDLDQMRGKVVMLLFWDSESKFSAKALWAVNELYKTYHAQGVEFWGLNFDPTPDKAKSLLENEKIEWPQYLDLPAGGKIQQRFGLYTPPILWAVDKKGVLRELQAEHAPQNIVKKLLAE
jgi:hypothetical protein